MLPTVQRELHFLSETAHHIPDTGFCGLIDSLNYLVNVISSIAPLVTAPDLRPCAFGMSPRSGVTSISSPQGS